MEWKRALMVLAVLAASGNVSGQGEKSQSAAKEVKKQSNENVQTQPVSDKKTAIRKSSNPDSLEFIGVPAVIKDPNRP